VLRHSSCQNSVRGGVPAWLPPVVTAESHLHTHSRQHSTGPGGEGRGLSVLRHKRCQQHAGWSASLAVPAVVTKGVTCLHGMQHCPRATAHTNDAAPGQQTHPRSVTSCALHITVKRLITIFAPKQHCHTSSRCCSKTFRRNNPKGHTSSSNDSACCALRSPRGLNTIGVAGSNQQIYKFHMVRLGIWR
jgi:hypothetical protein